VKPVIASPIHHEDAILFETYVRNGSMLLKKSLSTADQNFSRSLMRFSDKNVRNLVS